MAHEYNMNDIGRVILTAFGANVYNAHWAKLKLPASAMPKTLAQGDEYSSMLWEIMAIFGHTFHMGMQEVPFKNNAIWIEQVV